jgi:hypothetical protein
MEVLETPSEEAEEVFKRGTHPNVRPHQFLPGQSGNPRGRPKGSKNKMKALAEGLIGTNASKIVRKVIEMALKGDQACLKMCMDRIIPAQRAIDIEKNERKEQTINITVEAMQDIPRIVTKVVEGETIDG